MVDFAHEPLASFGEDDTEYELLTDEYVGVEEFHGDEVLVVQPEGLTLLAEKAMHDGSFFLRESHNASVAAILSDPEASENDKYVARTMLQNAVVSAEEQLPLCQDTGTATILAKKGAQVFTGGGDEEALTRGVFNTYASDYLRYSQTAPLTLYDEKNTGSNLPAQIDLYAADGDEYRFLFIAKGGGSANKTSLYQQTKALLNPDTLLPFLVEKMKSLGTAACPPYHIGFVIGGTSADWVLKMVKLATAGYCDNMPTSGDVTGRAFRDLELEEQLLAESRKIGLGAQFGGPNFAHDIRVIRGPRHGASCPVGMAVSCSAHRNVKAKIDKDGLWIEKLDKNPARWLVDAGATDGGEVVKIDLDQPMDAILAELTKYPVKTRLSLAGTMVVGRDIAHAKIKERIDAGESIPEYLKNHPIYYAGPAKTPEGMASGSFGPTTAGRMDSYVDLFQSLGGSKVMIAKGNRSQAVTDACKKHGGFYLGSIGGPAAALAKDCITKVEVLEYPELGMEAVWRIAVQDFPAFILVDDKGNDFFQEL
ncbi:MAG: fumarate hydratase [bacterium]|nr:fumarate hydratase [bacterium]